MTRQDEGVTGKVLWYCGLTNDATQHDKTAGSLYCKSPRYYKTVRHLRVKYGCGWYELVAMKEAGNEWDETS